MLRYLVLFLLIPLAARAEPPRVVADIAPVHSLVQMVMAGVGEADLLLPATASPHDYALRPSDAVRLQSAEVVFWVGPGLTPWLKKPLDVLGGAETVALFYADGTYHRPMRLGAAFPGHGGHGHGDDDKEHGHDGDGDHGKDRNADGHLAEDHDDHKHASDDPHAWLDPVNARLWVGVIAETLAAKDPGNAERYRANAAAAGAVLSDLTEELRNRLSKHREVRFLVDHDAYGYFEDRFGLSALGAVSDGHAARPGAKRVQALREVLEERPGGCVLRSPETPERALTALISGLDVRVIQVDQLGVGIEPGVDLYARLLTGLAEAFVACAGSK